jgi:hypothetical protein
MYEYLEVEQTLLKNVELSAMTTLKTITRTG